MASSRVPQQLFQGKGLWQQLWETPTLLWEAPRLGLDTAQGLDLLTLLGTVLALGALLLNSLRHPFVYLLLWVAYRSAYQVGQVFLYFQWDSLLLETGFLAILVAPLRGPSKHKILQGRLAGALPHEDLPFWLVRWLLFRLMFASGVVKLTSRCPTWFAALGPHTHSPWFTGLVLRLLQGKEPVIRLVQSHVANYPFHERPPTYLRAQRYKYWFSKPGDQSRWWHRQWVEEFFPSVSLGDPTLETLLQQFGLKDKSPPRARSPSNGLAQTLNWVRTQLSPLEPPILLWGLFGAVVAIRVVQTLLAPRPLQSSKQTREEKRKQTSKKDSRAASEQAAANSNSRDSWAPRRKK